MLGHVTWQALAREWNNDESDVAISVHCLLPFFWCVHIETLAPSLIDIAWLAWLGLS